MNISNQKNNIPSARTSNKKYVAKTTSSRTNEKTFSNEKKSISSEINP
ncbi:hypothetical protein EV144_101458 [Flavobacterium sp. 270]|nr:hypothetical protein [Flavobacterium sp. 270]TDW51781.1 hypothetical protein EV144_101458 [Flavobacterium sp. 270]